MKWSSELKLEREQLELRVKQLSNSITVRWQTRHLPAEPTGFWVGLWSLGLDGIFDATGKNVQHGIHFFQYRGGQAIRLVGPQCVLKSDPWSEQEQIDGVFWRPTLQEIK